MTEIDDYLGGTDIHLQDGYVLNIKHKNNKAKLNAIMRILDGGCSIHYIGFNDSDVGADCFVIKIRPTYNLIVKNKPDEWHCLCLIFGSMTEIFTEIDFDVLTAQYPRRIKGSPDVHTDIKWLRVA